MTEEKRLKRRMIIVTVWTLFITLTLAGLIVAYNQTRYVLEGYEPETIIFPFLQFSIHSPFAISKNSCYHEYIL